MVRGVMTNSPLRAGFRPRYAAGNEWIRVAGTLVRDDRREPKVDMLEHYPELKSMYSPDDDNTETLYFKDATATFYSFTAAPRTVKF